MIILRYLWNRPVIAFELAFSALFVLSFLVSGGFAQDTNTFSNNTSNVTGEVMTRTENVVNVTSDAASNDMQTAMDNTMTMASNASSNATGTAMQEANVLISAASNASTNVTNATETTMAMTLDILDNATNNVSSVTTNKSSSLPLATVSNYSSDLYQIQFHYPSDWQVHEKTGRFDEGSDLEIKNPALGGGFILVQYGDDPTVDFGSRDFTTALYDMFKSSISGDYSYEYRVIEQPTFLTIDGQNAGTFLYTFKDKYEDNAWTWGSQVWLVYVGDHAYMISFTERTDDFDSPENIQIRDQFIKSINFLGNTTSTNTPGLGRFAE